MNPDKWQEDYFILRVEPASFVVIRHFYSNCAGGELSSQHGAPMRVTLEDIRPQEKPPRIMPPLYAWKPLDFCKYAETMIKGRTIYEYASVKRY